MAAGVRTRDAFGRRVILVSLLSAAPVVALPSSSEAQKDEVPDPSISKEIETQATLARYAEGAATKGPLDVQIKGAEQYFLTTKQSVVVSLKNTLTAVPPGQRHLYVDPKQTIVLQSFVIYNINLVPRESAAEPRHTEQTTEHEDLSDVITDIVLDTLGIEDAVEKFRKFFDEDTEAKAKLADIESAIRSKNASSLVTACKRLFVILSSPRVLDRLTSAIGDAEVRRLLQVVASDFVPFIGWALLAGSFAFAVRHNWKKLQPFL